MLSSCNSCQILLKLEFSQQIFEVASNTKFHWNLSIGSQVVQCRRTVMAKLTVNLTVLQMRLIEIEVITNPEWWNKYFIISRFIVFLDIAFCFVGKEKDFNIPKYLNLCTPVKHTAVLVKRWLGKNAWCSGTWVGIDILANMCKATAEK